MRKRITFTIREDLLRSLDNTVDGQKVRNRSHALEHILARSFRADNTQAVILASGHGVKMRPFTYEIPKPLIPVRGRPLLEYSLELLKSHGITDIVITISHLGDKIEEQFGDGGGYGVSIRYVRERKASGTGSSLWHARKHINTSPFLLLYADVLLQIDLTELIQLHQNFSSGLATLALAPVADPSDYGAVKMRGTNIVDFIEKPKPAPGVSHLVFAGCGVFDQQIFDRFPGRSKAKEMSLEKDVFPTLINRQSLHGYPF